MKKKLFAQKNKVSKGAPSGLVVSILFHAAIFFVAGLFVVFQVIRPAAPEFEPPPPIERPKMKLKKPKVKVKKSSQPKPSSRIVAKVKTKQMPEIQLPDLVGSGEGLLGTGTGDGGDFLDLPALGELSLFGTEETIGSDLVGTFYDLKRNRSGGGTPQGSDPHTGAICPIFREFLESGWNKRELNRFWKSERKLYTTTLIIPETPSVLGPLAFGEDIKTGGWAWAVLYEGTLISYRDIRFRFWGMGDNFLAVGVDGETVFAHWLDGLDSAAAAYFAEYVNYRAPPTAMTYAYAHEGSWIELKAGEPRKLQIIISEFDGGGSSYMLCVEEDGVDYPYNPYRGGTTYPIFQMSVQSRTQVEELERVIYPGDASINDGPIFQDFEPGEIPDYHAEEAEEEIEEETAPETKVRTWILADGTSVEAELVNQTAGNAWLKTADGREVKVPMDRFSNDDQTYLSLEDVPRFRIDFTEKVHTLPPPPNDSGRYNDSRRPVEINEYTFKARVKLMDTTRYTYPLTVEYYAIGKEIEGNNNYILWQRSSKTFTPSRENGFEFEFGSTQPIRRIQKSMMAGSSRLRGETYDTYLVTVTDQRGEIIAYRTPNEFLYTYLDRLKELPVTRHFDNECRRVFPSRPIDGDRLWADPVFERSIN